MVNKFFKKWSEMARKLIKSLFCYHAPPPPGTGGGIKLIVFFSFFEFLLFLHQISSFLSKHFFFSLQILGSRFNFANLSRIIYSCLGWQAFQQCLFKSVLECCCNQEGGGGNLLMSKFFFRTPFLRISAILSLNLLHLQIQVSQAKKNDIVK